MLILRVCKQPTYIINVSIVEISVRQAYKECEGICVYDKLALFSGHHCPYNQGLCSEQVLVPKADKPQ